MSYLLDVCRGRVAVTDAADAACILAALHTDPAVRPVRVRNYMGGDGGRGAGVGPCGDPGMSGGFHVRYIYIYNCFHFRYIFIYARMRARATHTVWIVYLAVVGERWIHRK